MNTTDDKILSLIECNNEEDKQENSNKNPTVNSVQRDYMAGEISKMCIRDSNEARTPQEKHDLAMIVEETLRQRYEGVKNEAGVWITPAFPKLILSLIHISMAALP